MNDDDQAGWNRWPIYHLLIVVALALAAGRIAVVKSAGGDTAFLSANDRSRWATVASLVERGTYVIDEQIALTHPVMRNRRPWDSIDKVRHLGRDGKQHYYSSKPPLLATMVAGVYKLVHVATGMTLTQQPVYVARLVLAIFNLPLLAIFFYATIATMDRLVRSHWAGLTSAAACCFGTLVVPFAVTLNNHLPACAATALVMWLYVRNVFHVDPDASPDIREVSGKAAFFAGLGAALAAANELPALSMTVLWFLLFARLNRSTIVPFAFATMLVAAAFFGTNWIAHESWRPPYAHRGNGPVIAELEASGDAPDEAMSAEIRGELQQRDLFHDDASFNITPSDEKDRWIVHSGERQFALLKQAEGWQLADWDDWYEYPGTYWKKENLRGVDRGEPSRLVYLLHLTVGHHGLFSLTPIWLLMPVGLIAGLGWQQAEMRRYWAAVLLATLVCFLFYLNRPLIDRNYGGVSIGFRWLLWFAPLWLVSASPVIDRLSHGRIARGWVLVLLASSVFSVAVSLESPWQPPWLYQFWRFLGWINV